MLSCFLLSICPSSHKMQWLSRHLRPLLSPSSPPPPSIQREASKLWLPWLLPRGDHTHTPPASPATTAELGLSEHLQYEAIGSVLPRHLSLPVPALCPVYDSPVASTLQETPREFSNHFLHLQPVSQWSLLEPCSPVRSQLQLHQLLTGLHGQRYQARPISWSPPEVKSQLEP